MWWLNEETYRKRSGGVVFLHGWMSPLWTSCSCHAQLTNEHGCLVVNSVVHDHSEISFSLDTLQIQINQYLNTMALDAYPSTF